MVELDGRLVSCFLGAIVHGNIVEINLTLAIREVSWLNKVRDKNLAAVWSRISRCHAHSISAGSDIDIAVEQEDFATHVNTTIAICSGLSLSEMIASQRFSESHKTGVRVVALNYDCLTIVDVNVCRREAKHVTVNIVKARAYHQSILVRVGRVKKSSKSVSLGAEHVELASHNQVFVADRNVWREDEFAWRSIVSVKTNFNSAIKWFGLRTNIDLA